MKRAATLSLYEYQRRAVMALTMVLLFSVAVYGYFLNETIRNIVVVEDSQKQVTELRSGLSTLENEYLAGTKDITLDKAYFQGFVDAATPIYISQGTLPAPLSLNNGSQ